MTITFNEIPADLLVPGGYIEFDASRAGSLSEPSVILLIGEKIAAATASLNTITQVQSETAAIQIFGKDSMLHHMCRYALKYNYGCEIHAAAVSDETSEGALDIQPLITAMGDEQYDFIANPYADASVLALFKDEANRRFHAMQANRTHVFTATSAGFADSKALTESLNSSHLTMLPVEQANDSLALWVAAFVAIAGDRLHNDPAAPLTNVLVPELVPPGKLYNGRETNECLHAGLSAWSVVGSSVYIRYLVTTYQLNAAGDRDTAYRDIQVPEILKRFRRRINYEVNKTYVSAGYKLAKNSADYAAGQKIVDVDDLKGFLYSLYLELFMRQLGWMQDKETYRDNLVLEISPDNHDRVNYIDVPTLIGQFRVFAGQSQFITK